MKSSQVKKKKNEYFTQEVQDAVLRYVATTSASEKNELFKTIIGPKLKELIDNIVQVWRFGSLPNITFLKEECLLYLISVLNKFNPDKISERTQEKSKAFTYFTVISKNWFLAVQRKNKKKKWEEINIDELTRLGNSSDANNGMGLEYVDNIVTYNEYDNYLERFEFKQELLNEMMNWKDAFKDDQNFQKTLSSLCTLIENADEIDFFNKKGIFVYLRELTGLETKEISASLKKMAIMFDSFKELWYSGNI